MSRSLPMLVSHNLEVQSHLLHRISPFAHAEAVTQGGDLRLPQGAIERLALDQDDTSHRGRHCRRRVSSQRE
jgi:hypothetical protein